MRDVVTLKRVGLAAVVVLALAIAWTAWLAWRTERDLRDAERAADRLEVAIAEGDDVARDQAVDDLRDAAASARGRTDGVWWSAMTHLPVYGDDAAGVEALSDSISLVAEEAVAPLVATADSLDDVVVDGRVDVDQIAAMEEPLVGAAAALRRASDQVESRDSSGYAPALRTRFDDYVDRVAGIAGDFDSAQVAVSALPDILGASGPRDYLFVFQNNAEIRSTGGLPGSWARVHVEDGRLEMREQGSASDLAVDEPVLELTAEEKAVYDELPVLFFQDPNFIPDFPRAAEIFDAFWQTRYDVPLDGVVALDPVSMSYLMEGTGPVAVGDLTLTSESIVTELLSTTYTTIDDPAAQDRRFQAVARALFTASLDQLESPTAFVRGAARAIDERRMLFAPFDDTDREQLDGATVVGELSGDDGSTPHVDIGLNDATGSKMSYYLRTRTEVAATGCTDGVQSLEATVLLHQTVSQAEARALPDYVTGGAAFGIPVGSQLVTLRIYGPYGGTIADVRAGGEPLEPEYGLTVDGRPVVTVAPIIDTTNDVRVTWTMTTGAGQEGDGVVQTTPGILPGGSDTVFASSC